MINRLSRSMECNPITCCSVMRWTSTTHGMKRPQHTKTVGAFRPLERGFQSTGAVDIFQRQRHGVKQPQRLNGQLSRQEVMRLRPGFGENPDAQIPAGGEDGG